MVHIVGAGIAGLLLAERLDRLAVPWQLWEKSATVGNEASGKNAGIIRSYEADPVLSELARRSLQYYHKEEPSFVRCGIALLPWEVDYLAPEYPTAALLNGKNGILLQNDGCVEPMAVLERLVNYRYQHGKIHFSVSVELEIWGEHICWHLNETECSPSDIVVLACGEGAIAFDRALKRGLNLVPHLRTLYEYHNAEQYRGPVQWDEESGCYFRAAGEILVATAGEQIPVPPRAAGEADDQEADPTSPDIIAQKYPFLSRTYLRSWRSCRRLMPLDNRPYCGRDPQVAGLYWLTGLGGRGMSIAPAITELLAQLIAHGDERRISNSADVKLLTAMAPARVLPYF